MDLTKTTTLQNGVKMPWLGLGVYKVEVGQVTKDTVASALEIGYRSIDTASFYENEEGVGEAIRESGIAREDLFITTKVWNDEQGYEETLEAFDRSLEKLGLDYVDLYLIHWPVPGKYKDTWRALEKLYKEKRVRAIGVSNFLVHHLEDLMETAEVMPMVDQVEFHPRLSQPELQEFCKKNHIQLEAWAPIGKAQYLDDPTLVRISEKHGKTPAQVILRWEHQKGVVIIPKSTHKERQLENASIYDFELDEQDIKDIDAMDREERIGKHPDKIDYVTYRSTN